MIERNIGTIERLVRAVLGALLVGWVLTGQVFGLPQGGALLAAFALFWNSIFARCYLWKWLNLSSCDPRKGDCPGPKGKQSGV
jgi:hypothetical protein